MRATASACICRLLVPGAVHARAASNLANGASTSSQLLFPATSTSKTGASSLLQKDSSSSLKRHASSKAGSSTSPEGRASSESAPSETAPGNEGTGGPGDITTAIPGQIKGNTTGFQQWLNGETGRKYKRPYAGRTNWLGRTPFPLNPTFRPPTPLSHSQKDRIYRQFLDSLKSTQASATSSEDVKSETFHVRQVALKNGLSLDRVRAIVRLKALEYNTAAAGKDLQMQYLNGMEQALGVSTGDNAPLRLQEAIDVQQETEALFKTPNKSHWLMIDDESLLDLKTEKDELERKQKRDERKARKAGGEQIPRDVREAVRSRTRVPAGKPKIGKTKRPEIEFVDVASRQEQEKLEKNKRAPQ